MEQQVQRAVAHILCDYAEKLRLIADSKDLDDVVEPGFVKHFCLFQKTVPLSTTTPTEQLILEGLSHIVWINAVYIQVVQTMANNSHLL